MVETIGAWQCLRSSKNTDDHPQILNSCEQRSLPEFALLCSAMEHNLSPLGAKNVNAGSVEGNIKRPFIWTN